MAGNLPASGGIGTTPGSPPTLSIAVTPQFIATGETALVEWMTSNANSCVASGNWFGDKNPNGSETVGPLQQTAELVLTCTGNGGTTAEAVTIHVGTEISASGKVDSSFVNPDGENRIYVFSGNVVPDDLDGDSGDPILIIPVDQISNTCSWEYKIPSLPDGEYTVAFTNEAERDTQPGNEELRFYGTRIIQVNSSQTVIYNIVPKNILKVGKSRLYKTPSEALMAAVDGDVIEIDADTYQNDIAVIRQNNLVLRGVGNRAHLQATRIIQYTPGNDRENGMGIWVVRGSNIKIENMEFSGAKVPDQNGAGIRNQGSNLMICNSYFHDNENGLLGGAYGKLRIEYSEFSNNGLGEYGRTHNIYIDEGDEFIIKHSYSHHANIGHNIKTRARINYILFNRIMDEDDGKSSYAIDVSNGGMTYLIGNIIQQGIYTGNSIVVTYGAEGLRADGRKQELYIINNTIVNDRGSGTFLDINAGATEIRIINNIFAGSGVVYDGTAIKINNLVTNEPGMIDRNNYNYRLTANSSAVDAGIDPGTRNGYKLEPRYQYLENSKRETRPVDGVIDIGAYEFSP